MKINAEEDTVLAKRFSISGYPTSVLLEFDGTEIDRIVGYLQTEEYLDMLRDYKNGKGTLGDLLRRSETEQDRALFFEIADKYKYSGGSRDAEEWFGKVIKAGEATDSLSGEASTALADMYYRAKEYDRAMTAYRAVKESFGPDSFGELADIYCAIIYSKKGDTTSAVTAFTKFIKDYPESEDVEYANKQIAKLTQTAAEEN